MAVTNKPKREGIMLCYPAEQKRVEKLGNNFFTQPKLKGERCRVEWFHNEPVLLTSQANEFKYVDHIKQALKDNFKHNKSPLDGEIYVHGWSEEKIRSVAGRTVNEHPESSKLQFHVFDFQLPIPQWRRIQVLQEWNKEGRFNSPLIYVPTEIVWQEEWLTRANEYIQMGYEGIILRHALANYEIKRSRYILKYKPTSQDTYTVIGFTEGEGWAEGHLGAFIVRGDDGTSFKVGSGKLLTKERRAYFWSIREELLGKDLIVKHEDLKTSGGVPVCAVAYDIIL